MDHQDPKGVVAVLVDKNGTEIATAADFKTDKPGGFKLREAQEHRVKRALAGAVMSALAAPRLVNAIDDYTAEQIMRRMCEQGHRVILVPISHED